MRPQIESPVNNPLCPFSLSLWNANGLRATTISDVLSHVNTSILFITESWLTSGYLPCNWSQYHLYGRKVLDCNGRGSGGVSALVSPYCPFPVSQLPSPNAYTLSIKIGTVNVHCVYFPPTLARELIKAALRSIPIPLGSDTILCGDFNARLGNITGDSITTPRGADLINFCEQRDLLVLNSTLAYGISTFHAFRRNVEQRSIIDLFITNIPEWNIQSPTLVVESDLSLSSDHRLMHLFFEYDSLVGSEGTRVSGDDTVAPRRLWRLSRLGQESHRTRLQSVFKSLVSPVVDSLSLLVSYPPVERPDVDSLNHQLNDCIYQALDASIGPKTPNSGKQWKKYWSPEIKAAALERDLCYGRWRNSVGLNKIHWWSQHKEAHRNFRRLVSAAKRLSWKNFCASLEKDFVKATGSIAQIKRRRQCSSTYAHLDGPQASVDNMARHLSGVYNGSILPGTDCRPPPPPSIVDLVPFSLPEVDLFDVDTVKRHIRRLPKRKAPGSDHLKAEMLKALSVDLAPVLSLLFSLCYQWSYTPSLWREANVFPIHKKGDPHDPANYRPISLTSVMRKLFEFTLTDPLTSFAPPT